MTMPDSIGPVREPADHRPDPASVNYQFQRARADKAEAEVERLRAERRELREALAFYDPHAPAAIEHECRNA
jgi:cell division protein FtsB